jgi:hypothetical protein
MHGGDYHGDVLTTAALHCAARGWYVLPCDPGSKRPLIERGLHAASTDTTQIEAWWQQWPFAMIGIRTGRESGIIVLDIDVDPDEQIDGFAAIAELEKRHAMLPDTLRSTTPRGGEHLYFKWHDGVHNNAGKLGDYVDVRGANGYVIVPPSMRADRKTYSWREDCAAEPVEAPAWLIELLTAKDDKPTPINPDLAALAEVAARQRSGNGKGYGPAALDAECANVASAPKGQRNHTLNAAAFSLGQLVGAGVLMESEVKSALLEAASACALVKDDGRTSVEATTAACLLA